MKILANKEIKNLFLSLSLILGCTFLLAEFFLWLSCHRLSLSLLILLLLANSAVCAVCFVYFSILLGLCNSFVTIIVGIIACRENMTLSTIIIGTIQICGMALFTFIGEMPLIAHCGKKQNSFKGGAVAAFLLGYISIYFKNPIIRNLYPLSAGLSIVGFNGEGFVTDTTGAYSSSQSILLGVLTMLAMLILSLIIISIPQKETLATPLSQKRRKTERKIAK